MSGAKVRGMFKRETQRNKNKYTHTLESLSD